MSKKRAKISLSRNTWHHIRRSPFQSLAAILIMWLNFLMASLLVVLVLGFGVLLSHFESRPEVTAFLKDDSTKAQIQQLQQKAAAMEGVKEVRFVSKDEALKIYREQNKDNPLLLEMVSASILPASLEIAATEPGFLVKIADFLKGEKKVVEEVIFQQDVVERLSFWVKTIRNGGIIAVGFLSFVSLVVIMVIIGMKIAAHQDEISVLRSLGAANFYIQGPFLLEGIFYGITGALLGLSLVFGVLFYFRERIEGFFDPISVLPQDVNLLAMIFAGELLAGAILGLIASWLATRRYLKK